VPRPLLSIVRSALEVLASRQGLRLSATALRLTLAHRWAWLTGRTRRVRMATPTPTHAETDVAQEVPDMRNRSGADADADPPTDVQGYRPQPVSAFPGLQRFIGHDPWLMDPNVLAQHVWDEEGWAGRRYSFFILHNGRPRTLGMLIRERDSERELEYCRLYPTYELAALDSTLWAREIKSPPDPHLLFTGGIQDGHTWTVRVVRRQRRWEVHVTEGGLIPWVRDYKNYEDAHIAAEDWLTALHHSQEEDEFDYD
jgi:hypothetical protein